MSFLTELSLKRASVTLLAAVFIVLAGIYAALKINQELTPDVDFPLVTVVTAQMGAGPQDIADDVTTPLEGVISGVQGIKGLQSISADSTSIVIA